MGEAMCQGDDVNELPLCLRKKLPKGDVFVEAGAVSTEENGEDE